MTLFLKSLNMLHNRLTSAITKAGYNIEEVSPNSFKVMGNGSNYITWHKQDDKAICVCRRDVKLVDDAMTDLFYGSFTDTIKRAVNYLKGGY